MTSSNISFDSRQLEDLALPHEVSVDARTGAVAITAGVPLTAGRSGFQPALALAYSSSAPNSAFGLGWSLSGVPSVGRSSKDGLPRYDESDTYAFGGVEIVPWLEGDGRMPRVLDGDDHWIHVYRSTRESSFKRFERWVDKRTRRAHWRVRDRGGAVSVFGRRADGRSRIADPDDEDRVFEWLLEWQYDTHGNAIHYAYDPEDARGVEALESYERGRAGRDRHAQRYLRRIDYGNRAPLGPDDPDPGAAAWLFSVVFDYGERDGVSPPPHATDATWPARQDPFSSYRSGFEVRTYRLCRRILMFHHIPEALEDPATLVGALTLDHRADSAGSTLTGVRYTGYRRDAVSGDLDHRDLPPLVFRYTRPEVERAFAPAPILTHENVPAGLGAPGHRMIDLHGEGLPGLLFEAGRAWYYKSNLGAGRFGTQRKVLERPAIQPESYAFSDFDGDGNLDLVVLQGREAGHYAYDRDEGRWTSFRAFPATPHVGGAGAGVRLLDLDGDGRADIVVVDQQRITWYRSRGKEGFEAPVELSRPRSNGVSRAPTIGAEPNLDYFFADMTGDGLPDQVRVTSGRVEYWPQLGHGRFGAGVVMEGAPVLDFDGAFDAARVRLVDLDGSGTSDLVYIGRGELRYWINASGNRLVEGGTIRGLPYIDTIDSAAVVDFLGNGTSCLVWSTALPGRAGASMQYLQLTGGVRPRLIEAVDDSMGRETRIDYGHSARHYLRDLASGRGWVSKLPRHTTVVDRLEVLDRIGSTRFESVYEYHDGFFDGDERAFRGFGLVDRYDTDVYRGTSSVPERDYADPVCVRTWFHNGAAGWTGRRTRDYYAGDREAARLPGPLLEDLDRLAPGEFVDAYRALAGQVLRTEMYGVDRDGNRAEHPYQVVQASHRVRRLQPTRGDDDACFAVFPSESLTYVYEQNPDDPRINHSLVLAVDDHGEVTRSCRVAYARRAARRRGIAAQERTHVEIAESGFFHADEDDRYELGVPLEGCGYEVAGMTPSAVGGVDAVFRLDDFAPPLALLDRRESGTLSPEVLRHHQPFTSGTQLRLMRWERTHYWDTARTSALPWGEVGAVSLPHHTETACMTDGLRAEVFGERVTREMMREEGLYRLHDDHWWLDGPVTHYLPAARFDLLEREVRTVWREGRPEPATTSYTYDDPLYLSLREVRDAAGNRTRADRIDYVVVAPDRIVDANDNVSEVRYDALGVVVVSTAHGRVLDRDGREQPYGNEPLASHAPRAPASLDELITDPERFLQGASSYFYYELDSGPAERPHPRRNATLVREAFVHDGEGVGATAGPIQIRVEHVDGFGRAIQTKERVGPGPVAYSRDEGGEVVVHADAPVEVEERWRASGHTVLDNKQQIVRAYEPFFSRTHAFEPDEALATFGHTTVTAYDPLGRVTEVRYPNDTRARTEYLAWETRQHDPNDTVLGSDYEAARADYGDDHPEKIALDGARAHAGTATHVHIDALGRNVAMEEDGAGDGTRRTETTLDVAGNPIALIDPLPRTALTYRRDMLGRAVHEHSIDSGDRWSLADANGLAIHAWAARGVRDISEYEVHQHVEYDLLARPVAIHVDDDRDTGRIAERMVYGDEPGVTQPALRNLRGRLAAHHDQAGVVRVHRYDPAGNPLHHERQLAADYRRAPDWRPDGDVALEGEPFATHTRYDALGRTTRQELPDGTTRGFEYLPGGGVGRVRVSTADGAYRDRSFVGEAAYDARGQRTLVVLGDPGATTAVTITRDYDPQTHHLRTLESTRGDGRRYQELHYTYDPAGNLVHVVDGAQAGPSGAFYAGIQDGVGSGCTYTYDAFYRLRFATGRVHQALEAGDYDPERAGGGIVKASRGAALTDLSRVRRYRREYRYDIAGNLREMVHTVLRPDGRPETEWRRAHWVSGTSNRALPTDHRGDVPSDPESRFERSGHCVSLPHLHALEWDYRGNLARAVIVPRADTGEPDDAEHYVYGGDGLRVRRVTELFQHGRVVAREKVYVDGCEIVRTRIGDSVRVDRKVSHITDGAERVALVHQWIELDDAGAEVVTRRRIRYQLSNELGSASLELGEDGEVLSYEEYFPYGGTAFIAHRHDTDLSLKEYRYTGKERDDATSFYYYGHRYYAPWLGRWLSPDPLGPVDGPNLYEFVRSNPVNLVDPDGLQSSWRRFHVVPNRDQERGTARPAGAVMTVQGPGTPSLSFNPADFPTLREPGEHWFEGRHGSYAVHTNVSESGSRQYYFMYFPDPEPGTVPELGVTAVVDAPPGLRRRRAAESDAASDASDSTEPTERDDTGAGRDAAAPEQPEETAPSAPPDAGEPDVEWCDPDDPRVGVVDATNGVSWWVRPEDVDAAMAHAPGPEVDPDAVFFDAIDNAPFWEIPGRSGDAAAYARFMRQFRMQVDHERNMPEYRGRGIFGNLPTPGVFDTERLYGFYDTDLVELWYTRGSRGVAEEYGHEFPQALRQLYIWLTPEGREEADALFSSFVMGIPTQPDDIAHLAIGTLFDQYLNEADPVWDAEVDEIAEEIEAQSVSSAHPPGYWTNARIGELGERIAVEILRERGYTEIVALQNRSGHGIDVFAVNPQGRPRFFEIKASTRGSTGRLSEAQQDAGEFVIERLRRLASDRSATRRVRRRARRLLQRLDYNPANVRGAVIDLTRAANSGRLETSARRWTSQTRRRGTRRGARRHGVRARGLRAR